MQRNIFANLSEGDRGRIIGLYESGGRRSDIVQTVGCSERTVDRWITKHRAEGTLKDHRKNNTRPRKTTAQQDQNIVQLVDENPFSAAATVLRNNTFSISVCTVKRRLKSAKVRSHLSAKKIALTQIHRNRRMQFAREHLNTFQDEWNAVIW